jgi:hypothetical protein
MMERSCFGVSLPAAIGSGETVGGRGEEGWRRGFSRLFDDDIGAWGAPRRKKGCVRASLTGWVFFFTFEIRLVGLLRKEEWNGL